MGIAEFNELRITPDSKYLIIDVDIPKEKYYKDVYLDSVVIDNQDTYINNGFSSKPIYSYTIPEREYDEDCPLKSVKHLRLVLDRHDLGSLDGIFFIYIRVKGTPSPDTPCGMDHITTMRAVCNIYPYYRQAMGYIKELGKTCSVPQNFIDYILKLQALKLSVKAGDYTGAIKYYNKFLKNLPKFHKKGGCGCGHH